MSELSQCQVHSQERCNFCDQCGLPMCSSCDPMGRACPLIHEGNAHFGSRPFQGTHYEYYDFGDGQEVLTGTTFTDLLEYMKGRGRGPRPTPPSREALQVPELVPPWKTKGQD